MPQLDPVANIESVVEDDMAPPPLDEPVTIDVVAKDPESGDEVMFTLRCRPSIPMGSAAEVARTLKKTTKGVTVDIKVALNFMRACILPECRDAWIEFQDDYNISSETIGEVYQRLRLYYDKLPQQQRTDSSSSSSSTASTGPDAASSLGSVTLSTSEAT